MNKQEFSDLLTRVAPLIEKETTKYREPISAEERLMVTIRYLATGQSMSSLHYEWCISVASISIIVNETTRAIYDSLLDYITTPRSRQEWETISDSLENSWGFPNALGALDGKHISTTKPWNAGSEFHNYKGFESSQSSF